MAEIVNPHVFQSCNLANTSPRMLKVCQMRVLFLPRDNELIFRYARQRFQQGNRSFTEMNGFRTSLAVGQSQFFCKQVHMTPFKSLNLRQAASGQEQDPEGSNGIYGLGFADLCTC